MRSVLRSFMLCALALITGCSFPQQFAKTAGPLAENIYIDESSYINVMADADPAKAAIRQRADLWITSVRAGDRDNTVSMWYSNPGVRLDYTTFLYADTRIRPETRTILLHGVTDLDYILSIGPKAAPVSPSPAR